MPEVCLLGTGGMLPLKDRFLTGLYAEYGGKAMTEIGKEFGYDNAEDAWKHWSTILEGVRYQIDQAKTSLAFFKDELGDIDGVDVVGGTLTITGDIEQIAETIGVSTEALKTFIGAFKDIHYIGELDPFWNNTQWTPTDNGVQKSALQTQIDDAKLYINQMKVLRETIVALSENATNSTEMLENLKNVFDEGW